MTPMRPRKPATTSLRTADASFKMRAPLLRAGPTHELQRSLGNRAVGQLLQAKLSVSQPGDLYEEEADRVADEVMRMPDPVASIGRSGGLVSGIQRMCSECEKEEVQRAPASESEDLDRRAGEIEPYLSGLSGRGQPLPDATRAYMEPRFGADFSDVRVHTDAEAAQSARAVDALAFTVGRDIVFGADSYAPQRDSGKKLLAHELTHVIQQGEARQPDELSAKLHRQAAPAAPAAPAPAAPAAAETTDPEIEALDLAATAEKAAYEFRKKHPAIGFTSGRRSVAEQARAMATNIVSDGRKWIESTYSETSARRKLQDWVDAHPEATTVDAIAAGLEETFNSLTDTQKGYVTKHITGEAFDVQPQTENADTIKADIQALPGITKFLEKEGGLIRWHAQFKRRAENSPHEREADRVALHGMGAPAAEDGVREHVGKMLGFDFSAVRVHREATEPESPRAGRVAIRPREAPAGGPSTRR